MTLRLAAALPVGVALIMPLLPLLIILANVLPPGAPIEGSRTFAAGVAIGVPVLAAISLIALVTRTGWAALWRTPLVAPLVAFIACEIIAALSRLAPLASALAIACQVVAASIYIAGYWALTDTAVRRAFLACFFASGIAATLFAIALVLSRHPPAAFAYLHGRAAGTFLQPNEFAGYLLFLIPLGIAQVESPAWLKRLGLAAALIGTAGLALSVSRAGWLGLIVGLPFLIVRFGRRALAAYAVAAVAAISLSLMPSGIRNLAHDPSENASRIVIWQGAARMVDRFGLTGIGPAAFSRVYPAYKMPYAVADEVHAHDLPLNILVEDGVLGFAAFVWLVAACIAQARRTVASIPASDRERTLLFGGLVAAFVASALQNTIDDVTTFVLIVWWPMMGLMLSLGSGMERSSALDRRPA